MDCHVHHNPSSSKGPHFLCFCLHYHVDTTPSSESILAHSRSFPPYYTIYYPLFGVIHALFIFLISSGWPVKYFPCRAHEWFVYFFSHPPMFSRFACEISGFERLGPWIFCVFAGCFWFWFWFFFFFFTGSVRSNCMRNDLGRWISFSRFNRWLCFYFWLNLIYHDFYFEWILHCSKCRNSNIFCDHPWFTGTW